MALTSTIHSVHVALSDVDRGVYEQLALRLAQHPSETMRYLATRLLAYALSYEEGIAFRKGGLSDADDAPVSVRDATGALRAWIEIGSPSAERMHRATKAVFSASRDGRVAIFTHVDLGLLRREAATQRVHALDAIEVFHFDAVFLDELAARIGRGTRLSITRSDGTLYVTGDAFSVTAPVVAASLVDARA